MGAFIQPSLASAQPPLRQRQHNRARLRLALVALACAAPGALAHAQQSASLPMAPSALHAASTGRLAAQSLADLSFTASPFTGHAFTGQPPQTSSSSTAANADAEQPTPDSLPLSLDEAIGRGLQRNLQVLLANQSERAVRGQISSAFFELLPNMKATAYTDTLEIDLAAMGFKPSSLAAFGFAPNTISTIVKVDTTSAQIGADQALFNLPDLYLYTAAKKAATVVAMNTLNVRGGVVQAVCAQYLAALADNAQIDNAQALVAADRELLRQATLAHDAGVGSNLDLLRARVQLQSEQQALLADRNAFAKDKIALTRLIGLPAGQDLSLTDAIPYADLAQLPLDQTLALAYQHRKDLLGLQAQLEVAQRAQKAVKYERLPSLAFNGDYGVLGVTHGSYHGVFTAQGTLKIPLFEEARFRGEGQVAAAQQAALLRQIASLRITIDAQIRASRLDVESSAELVKVARSNVDLATQALSDARDQFAAGVADDLPVVEAQAALAAAQSQFVATQFQFNQAKLTLALNTGVLETQYKHYLGR